MHRTSFSTTPRQGYRRCAPTLVLTLTALAGLGTGAARAQPVPDAGGAPTTVASSAPGCGTLFDDFDYSGRDDPALADHGWTLRSGGGGPGVGGGDGWSRDRVDFVDVDGQSAARLTARTDGTSAGTSQAELAQREFRFREGTYAARIRFSDRPVSGSGTARPNQTFYALSPLRYDWDPEYSELDFAEYLSRGGWGSDGPALFTTSYHSYQADPWEAQNVSDVRYGSLDGWHVISATATDGVIRYSLDGEEIAVHDRDSADYDVFPRSDMQLAFNHWFIDLGDDGSRGPVEYQEHVDWVLYHAGTASSPEQVREDVDSYRASGVSHTDDLGACG
ncbi:glycoside hydrolase family 16 protein [Phycicoccus sp. CSK15P-2]|uniref:glycoside hydrolase family 16 protein n=1 Tax=Phycicoccus sp. CSK15P-2 TaxID=2807627 RepID=UPI001951F549|nr:glycoside hydrolase family 16 protein [Phycicoccus sp. CSK15P-2]MBM6404652.1 glycoside hydrolase family 16 protein [Phycicoccus sp. CSK15P-2]